MLAFGQGKSERSIRMTLSLAFIAPPIVVATIEGLLPREITSIWADFLVELRGFEPLTTAEQAHARGDSAAVSRADTAEGAPLDRP
jgi:hypothetical protein